MRLGICNPRALIQRLAVIRWQRPDEEVFNSPDILDEGRDSVGVDDLQRIVFS